MNFITVMDLKYVPECGSCRTYIRITSGDGVLKNFPQSHSRRRELEASGWDLGICVLKFRRVRLKMKPISGIGRG